MSAFVQIAIWLISYFLSKKAGATSGQAALIASGAVLLSNETGLTDKITNGISDWYGGSKDPVGGGPNTGDTSAVTPGVKGAALGPVGSSTGSLGSGVSDVLKSWGPSGTVLVGATVGGAITDNKWLMYGGLAVLTYLILK